VALAVSLAGASVLVTVSATALADQGSQFRRAARSRGGVVSSVSRQASRVGIQTLDAGGNAIDAGVAMTYAMGVTRPDYCGPGAGGFLVYRGADGERGSLDFREQAPSSYEFTSGVFEGTPAYQFGTGHNVAGVPGMVAGMSAALRRYGTMSLSKLIAPAERLARDGVVVSPDEAYDLSQSQQRFLLFPESARTYLKANGLPYAAGETLRQPKLAETLHLIRKQGPQAFYEGPIAQAIVAEMRRPALYPGDPGTMSGHDLARYRAIWRRPVTATYRHFRLTAMPPPSSGGVATAEILNLLKGFSLRRYGHSSANALHVTAEAQKIAWADRGEYLADPRFIRVPAKTLTSNAYAAERRGEISMSKAKTYGPGLGPFEPLVAGAGGASGGAHTFAADAGGQTEHLSVIDRGGNAVSITCSNEQPFGSAVVPQGTGFVLNNTLTDFDMPGTANAPAPGKRPRSSQDPVVVSRGAKNVLAAGAAGGPSIIMATVGTILNRLEFGLGLGAAVDAERADARGYCDGGGLQLCVETARFEPRVLDHLRSRGHDVQARPGEQCSGGNTPCEYFLGTQEQAVGSRLRSGVHVASADPRNDDGEPIGDGALAQAPSH
jgi:gamma-glutamyltranspeptidase/glutathione hydrolase